MSPERSEKGKRLIAYVQENIQKLEAGEVTRLPTLKNLMNQFGYESKQTVHYYLRRHHIKLREYMFPYRLPQPSADLAWFLGILSGGGTTSKSESGHVRLTNTHENVLEKFRLVGERLFLLNARPHTEHGWSGSGYQFSSVKMLNFLGDLRSESWARTILSVHPWVVDNPRYIWGFINGFFEKRGRVNKDRVHRRNQIILYTSYPNAANLLAEMLVRVGIKSPMIHYHSESTERVKDLNITNLLDINLFTQHVHSMIPEEEKVLEYYRTGISLNEQTQKYVRRYTRERLIAEWIKVRAVMDGKPTCRKISKLNKDGETEISSRTYARRFGQGSFPKAREELERIIRERGNSDET